MCTGYVPVYIYVYIYIFSFSYFGIPCIQSSLILFKLYIIIDTAFYTHIFLSQSYYVLICITHNP